MRINNTPIQFDDLRNLIHKNEQERIKCHKHKVLSFDIAQRKPDTWHKGELKHSEMSFEVWNLFDTTFDRLSKTISNHADIQCKQKQKRKKTNHFQFVCIVFYLLFCIALMKVTSEL